MKALKCPRRNITRVVSVMLVTAFLWTITGYFVQQPAMAEDEERMKYFEYKEDTSLFLNPERGWFMLEKTDEVRSGTFGNYREKERVSLVLLETDLSAFLTGPMSEAELNEINSAFSSARSAGLSVIYRAAYDFNGKSKPEPKDINIILGHIAQLKDVFIENEDILLSVQAGFLGAYGEWHSSYYGDPIPESIQKAVVNALLDAVPPSITVAVRRPVFVRTINDGRSLTAAEAFTNTSVARVAYHNDAVLSTEDDYGTYSDDSYSRQRELDWTNNHTRYTPFICEANFPSKYNDPDTAVELMDYMNLLSLNKSYHPGVISKWRSTSYGGMSTYDYVEMMQGYRFVLMRAGVNLEPVRGGYMHLSLELENKGFGNLMKEKDFEIILKNGAQEYRTKIDSDARRWDDNSGLIQEDYYFSLPSDIPVGEWEIYLSLSSTFDSLKGNSAYSVRFANEDMWNESTGMNKIGTINIGQPEVVRSNSDFAQISASKAYDIAKSVVNEDVSEPVITITNNETTLTVQVAGIGAHKKTQIYVDSDADAATGYQTNGTELGYDYMIENEQLYKYAGSDNSWVWIYVARLERAVNNGTLTVELPLKLIGVTSNVTLGIMYRPDDSKALDTVTHGYVDIYVPEPPKGTAAEQSDGLSISVSDRKLYLRVLGGGLNTKSQFYLNSDDNTETGYRAGAGKKGYDYLIENNHLYAYSGTGASWSWKKCGPVKLSKTSGEISVSLSLVDVEIFDNVLLSVLFRSNDMKESDLVGSCLIETEDTVTIADANVPLGYLNDIDGGAGGNPSIALLSVLLSAFVLSLVANVYFVISKVRKRKLS